MISLRRNVLIFHQAALGDFVLTWPIALAAARLWPTQRVIYVTTPEKGQLAERAIGVEWRDGDALHTLFGDSPQLAPGAQKLLDGAKTILSFVADPEDIWARNVRALAPDAELLCVKARPGTSASTHLTLFHAEQFGPIPQWQGAIGQMLRHAMSSGMTANVASADRVLIHPGSGGRHKRWPVRCFAELAGALRASGHDVSILLGEVERAQFSSADLALLAAAAPVTSPASLIDLFETIRSARLYVGNDAGPTHLAALAGRPTLALFGPSDSVVWRPIGPGVCLLHEPALDTLSVDTVLRSATELLSRAPTAVPAQPADD
jgi:heptosyltransferase III